MCKAFLWLTHKHNVINMYETYVVFVWINKREKNK